MDENSGISRKIEQHKNRDFPSDIKAPKALNTAKTPALQWVRVFCRKRPFLPPFLHVGEKKERKRRDKNMSIHAGSPAVGQTKGEKNPMKTEFEYFEQLKKDYPDTMTKEQFYKAAHISKATALFLLQSGLVACKDSGKQTRRYTIKTNDVIAYLQDRILYPQKYAAPDGWYVGRSGHGKRKSPGEFPMLTTLTEAQCEKLKAYFMSEMSDLDDVLSVAQLADFLGYAPTTVVYWCNHNQVKHFDISGKYMIPKICIVEFLASQKSRSIRRKSYRHRLFLADFQNKYITA